MGGTRKIAAILVAGTVG